MKRLTLKKLISRKKTHNGVYADVGHILDEHTIHELSRFAIDDLGLENVLRYFLEKQITDYVINLER